MTNIKTELTMTEAVKVDAEELEVVTPPKEEAEEIIKKNKKDEDS